MFGNDKQKDIFKALGNPGTLTNPTAAVTASLLSASTELQAKLSTIAPPAEEEETQPGAPGGTTEPLYYDTVRKVSAMYDDAAGQVTSAASGMMDHAGRMVSDMAGTVGRFEAATKINRDIVARGACTDIMDAMGSIGGPGQRDIRTLGEAVLELATLIPEIAELEAMTLEELEQWENQFSGKVNDWKAKGQALSDSLQAELNKHVELDAVLSRFGVSSMLPGWVSDPCLRAVVEQCGSDELLELLNG